MATFDKETFEVNGVRTVVLTAGHGDPLVFFHGAGTFTGFDFALPWAEKFKLIVPYHPGFGDSADDPTIDDMQDYVMHYLDLFDRMGLSGLNLVGHSLGGWMAARFACAAARRVRRLVLISPAGLRVKEHPTVDLMRVPPEQVPAMLVEDFAVIQKMLPTVPDIEFIVGRYRESTSVARLMWERPTDRKLARWLHRITMPTLIVWGEKDKLIPVEQAEVWAKPMRDARIARVAGVGHLVLDEHPATVGAIADFLTDPKIARAA